jgi:hypothetical protein
MKGAGDHPVPEIEPEIEFCTQADVANAEGLVLNVSLWNVFFGAHCIQKPALLASQRSFASWLQNRNQPRQIAEKFLWYPFPLLWALFMPL